MQVRLAQVVAEQIRDSIIDTGLAAGEKLPTESMLMAEHSVSRSTIREAMKILQADAIAGITVANNKGATLPETGGMGTTILYAVGGLLVLGAAVLLITKKRMENN